MTTLQMESFLEIAEVSSKHTTDMSNNHKQLLKEAAKKALSKAQAIHIREEMADKACMQAMMYLFDNRNFNSEQFLNEQKTGYKNGLIMDGYNEELKIAFDYQGGAAHWDSKNPGYKEMSKKHTLKQIWCENLGVIFVQIPPLGKLQESWDAKAILNHVREAVIDAYQTLGFAPPALKRDGLTLEEIQENTHSIQTHQKIHI